MPISGAQQRPNPDCANDGESLGRGPGSAGSGHVQAPPEGQTSPLCPSEGDFAAQVADQSRRASPKTAELLMQDYIAVNFARLTAHNYSGHITRARIGCEVWKLLSHSPPA
ncbi:unnamed protein product [Phytophthora fragariaefolia]|uniref:Unnamed protein product n=1 Tax=Phytophthora fragariaefolia TaxID=1490495 RepID=A0A9W6XVV2_9STRA|nr:unnamed protein product [Phytophthora fragariaefolia]